MATKVQFVESGDDGEFQALYINGALVFEGEHYGAQAGLPITPAEVVEHIAFANISVSPPEVYRVIDQDYDQRVLAMEGWPSDFSEFPEGVLE